MNLSLLFLLVLGLALATTITWVRRSERRRLREALDQLQQAKTDGSHAARLLYPSIDLSQCIGCGLCVKACPEEGVLDIVHGQAVVVHGARCVGHGRCAEACPVGAIALTLGDVSERRDLPALEENLEAIGNPGVYLAGELTGFALVRTAVTHGTRVADEVAARCKASQPVAFEGAATEPLHDLCIIGAGPAGIACALQAQSHGLDYVVLEKDQLGGAVAHYPRGKMVMTQPVELPLHGALKRATYQKEELIDLWQGLSSRYELPIDCGVEFRGLAQAADGTYVIETSGGEYRARNVCLALGRRGIPRKLGVPGEDQTKVTYSLVDARAYEGKQLLVVGGGDSAIEAAVGLASQPRNVVHLSYRRGAFTRIKSRNERQLRAAVSQGKVRVILNSRVTRIGSEAVELAVSGGESDEQRLDVPNDHVFVMAGGTPPFEQLQSCGISFDPKDRCEHSAALERGTGLLVALIVSLAISLGVLAFTLWHSEYYFLAAAQRATSDIHAYLRPAGVLGVSLGVAAVMLMLANLFYLLRRSRLGQWLPGSLRAWMSSHLLTGILAFVCVLMHSGFSLRATSGGRALIALTIVVVAGAVGRYLYSFVPRAANGRELELDEVRRQLAERAGEWDRSGDFGRRVRREIQGLIDRSQWAPSLPRRLLGLLTAQRRLRRTLALLREAARDEGLAPDQIEHLLALSKRAHRSAMLASHYEDLRGLLASWRYLHRWLALLMLLMAAIHIVAAFRYAEIPGLKGSSSPPPVIGGSK